MINTVFFDVDTQVDFLFPAGALAVPGAAAMVNSLRALTSFAAKNQIPIISTADAHTENDPEFQKQGWQAILNNFVKYAESK